MHKIFPCKFKDHVLVVIALLVVLYGCSDDEVPGTTPPPDPKPSVFDWTFQPNEFFVNYMDIYFVSDKVGWVVGENNLLLSTVSGGLQWPEVPVNTFEGTFRSVHMVNEDRGWIAGDMNGNPMDGSVYISINGGAYPESQKITEFPINSIYMLDENYGWAGGENGQMLLTSDGINWIESTSKLDFTIYDIHFEDQQNGWVVGTNGNIYRSNDGGITWAKEYEIQGTDLHSIHLSDTSNGWACGTGNTFMIRTIENGNMKWTEKSIDDEFSSIAWYDLHFTNEKSGWMVGSGGTVYKTVDGGESWQKETTGLLNNLNAIHMVSESKGWIAGDEGAILTYTP